MCDPQHEVAPLGCATHCGCRDRRMPSASWGMWSSASTCASCVCSSPPPNGVLQRRLVWHPARCPGSLARCSFACVVVVDCDLLHDALHAESGRPRRGARSWRGLVGSRARCSGCRPGEGYNITPMCLVVGSTEQRLMCKRCPRRRHVSSVVVGHHVRVPDVRGPPGWSLLLVLGRQVPRR